MEQVGERERLSRHRRALLVLSGLTQEQVAERIGQNPATVSRVMAGQDARLDTLRKIAAVIGCSLSDLLEPEPLATARD